MFDKIRVYCVFDKIRVYCVFDKIREYTVCLIRLESILCV